MIDMHGLSRRFGSVTALKQLDLSVPKGELFCFLGPNGAGKTTTIKILTGLLKPTAGTATIGGFDVIRQPLEAKRLIGYIPDMPFLYDRLTATEFFEFMGDLYDVGDDVIAARHEELFAFFGLTEHHNALVRELSHGLRQRLIYASTFLHKPEVLFIDEPFIGLDPYTIRLIKDLLTRSARGGMTIFMTTHILALAQDVADRIGIVAEGRLAALGTLDELRRKHGGATLEDTFLALTEPPGGRELKHYAI